MTPNSRLERGNEFLWNIELLFATDLGNAVAEPNAG